MAWYDEDSWLTAAFAPNLSTIAVTLLLTILLPILLHQFIYRKATPTALPSFLLIGPSGAGKTAFLTLVSLALWSLGLTSSQSLTCTCYLDGTQHCFANSHIDLPTYN
jgi:signal recognition particle receptor subunit beta